MLTSIFRCRTASILAGIFLLNGGLTILTRANAEEIDLQSPVRGIVRASSQASISTDIAALVAHVGFKEGQKFSKGDVLISFDCRMQQAQLSAADAAHREKQIAFKSANYLFKQNAGSKQDVEIARAQSQKAAAETEVIRARLDRCEIKAPYDGAVSSLNINSHEMSVVGNPLISIVQTSDPEIELIVPSTWLGSVRPGLKFNFSLDDNQKSYLGIVKRTGATIDAVSQTIRVFATFENTTASILPGMSGTANFDGMN